MMYICRDFYYECVWCIETELPLLVVDLCLSSRASHYHVLACAEQLEWLGSESIQQGIEPSMRNMHMLRSDQVRLLHKHFPDLPQQMREYIDQTRDIRA